MIYKKKVIALSGIIGVLAVVYALTFIFDPERMGDQADRYVWLEPQQRDSISKISIVNAGESIDLVRNAGQWFVAQEGRTFPAQQTRAEDLVNILTGRAPFPVRSSSAASHERLSLGEDQAVAISVSGAAGQSLLELLVGQTDVTGQNVYLRKRGQNEVRAGNTTLSEYARSPLNSWFNLRLLPESEDGSLDVASVQRLIVQTGEGNEPYVFTRSGKGWTFENIGIANPDMGKVDSYIRTILNITADDFDMEADPGDPQFGDSSITLELGNRTSRAIRFGTPDESGRRMATVSGSDLVYVLSSWASQRLFVEPSFFELPEEPAQ